MTTRATADTVTILFTDLVDSTELLQKAGDEQAQRLFRAHHKLLGDVVAASGGQEVKWLGEGLMVAFPSAADAVRCAIAMQQAAQRPVGGERLRIRVGLNVGEPFQEEADYFGTPVVVAKRLCDRAAGGQILCSKLVAGLLSGRQAFTFRTYGALQLKGIVEQVEACEVVYEADQPAEPSPSQEPARLAPVTILFTDLVDSTDLLQKAGDERAQRVFRAHHKLLAGVAAANGGQEVKWLGDGLMVAFPSAADAVRCAIAMQQAAQRPVGGERLRIRVGLNVGEPFREEADYFGTPVVVARRLCDRADGGQILCSELVAGLLSGRQAFTFRTCGALQLKGIVERIEACEVVYEADQPAALLSIPPFVGRMSELAQLEERLADARGGRGGVVMLVGEPGVGKSRTAQEFADIARGEGVAALRGSCYEGESIRPYGPFAEALDGYVRLANVEELRADLGAGAGAITRLIPDLADRLPAVSEQPPLQPDEERMRLLDAVSQFLIRLSARAPLLLVLEDLHWADKDTIAMLRHVARSAPRHRILLLGTYRDVELDRQHPLADALAELRRETSYVRILLRGLEPQDIEKLLTFVADRNVPQALVATLSRETEGNPFFIREVLLHLLEAGAIYQAGDGHWASDVQRIEEVGIPESVRQVIGRRLARLSSEANRLLGVAAAFSGAFSLRTTSEIARLDEMTSLDALDEALAAQLLRPSGEREPDSYHFTHALIRNTLYTELSPSRQVRLHRQIAEAMERILAGRALDRAAELAYQYYQSAVLPGAERGAPFAIAAANRAEEAYAYDEAVTFLRMAIELLSAGDPGWPRLLGRLALALAWTLSFDEALAKAVEAADLIAASETEAQAADYLAQASRTVFRAGFLPGAWDLAAQGLRYTGDRRDANWAWLMTFDLLRREAEDPDHPGIPLDNPERREVNRVASGLPADQRPWIVTYYTSRADVLARAGDDDPWAVVFLAGEYHRGRELWQKAATQHERQGQIANAVSDWARVARCCNALGDFEAARAAIDRAAALAARLASPSHQALDLVSVRLDAGFTVDPDADQPLLLLEPVLQQPAAENSGAYAAIRAVAALGYAWLGQREQALRWLETLRAPLERAPGWMLNYTLMACLAAYALWVLERTDHIDLIERSVREKVIAPDFRFPMQDGRLSMARLCALQGRYEEAAEWFERARTVLDEQGARPLRAITDVNEAEMYLRRAGAGDRELAEPRRNAALEQFRVLGMTGWLRRAEQLVLTD